MNKTQYAERSTQNRKKILIVRLDRIGDVLLSTPALKAVRDAYPDSHLAVMVRPYSRDIVEGNPYLDEGILYDTAASEKTLVGNIKFIRLLREKKFDTAIILHPTTRSHILTAMAGIPERIGYDRKLSFLLTKRVPHTKQLGLKHEIDYTLGLLRYMGIASADRTLYMPVKTESEKKIRDLFEKNGIKSGDTAVVINPCASCASKRWNAEHFAKVADGLISSHNAKIIIIAGPSDKATGDRVASLMAGPSLNLSGKTTVADVAGILRQSRLFISNDSGPVHIACAVRTPVIAIFGRSDRGLSPERWGPSGEGDIVLHKDAGCRICLAHNCERGFKCLESITIADVLAAADTLLEDPIDE